MLIIVTLKDKFNEEVMNFAYRQELIIKKVVRINVDGGYELKLLKTLFGNRCLQAIIYQGFSKACHVICF